LKNNLLPARKALIKLLGRLNLDLKGLKSNLAVLRANRKV